jgi:hypothetical protein
MMLKKPISSIVDQNFKMTPFLMMAGRGRHDSSPSPLLRMDSISPAPHSSNSPCTRLTTTPN